jgi:hypothetical protein
MTQPHEPANKSAPANAPTQGPIPPGPPAAVKGGLPPSVQVRNRTMTDFDVLSSPLDPNSLDPNKAYRVVRIDKDNRSVLRKKLRGFTIETYRDGGPKLLEGISLEKRGDGAIVIGDGVLMSRPRALEERKRAERFKMNEELLAATTAHVQAEADAKGFRLVADPEHGVAKLVTPAELSGQ